jgi:hypothetical protein
MKKTPIFVLLFLLVCLPCLFLAKKLIPVWKSKAQQETSDAKGLKGKITLAIDDWDRLLPHQFHPHEESHAQRGLFA